MAVTVTGGGPAEMKLLAVRLREADPALQRELRRNMRAAAGPIVARVRASILSMPAVHGSPPGRVPLREALARTVNSSVRLTPKGVQADIVSLGSRMPRGEGNLNAYTGALRGWGHPVFEQRGREKVWVRQHGKPGWFERPITQAAPALKAAVQDAMDETKRKLEG
jgi:hypothetical protein